MKDYKNCPLCSGVTFNNVMDCVDYTVSKKTFSIVECDACKFQFTNPIPDENEIGKYYESEDYVSHSNTKKGLIHQLYQTIRNKTLKDKLDLVKRHSKARTILDIGTGTGEFLNVCKKAGLETKGIEPSENARTAAIINYRLDIETEEYLLNIPDESKDAVTMWHVLEHVYHLNNRIETIKRILKRDGTLFVAVPNRSSFDAEIYQERWAAYDLPRHLYHFTPNDIENLCNKHGLKLKKVLPMKFDSFYVSMLSEKYKNGKINYLSAFLNGLKSNNKAASKDDNTYSSQIYIIRKQN